MKILRLFINTNLSSPIDWTVLENEIEQDKGSSSFESLSEILCDQVEVYLNAEFCSIFKVNVQGITAKRLTEEVVLGMIEDNLVDDIESVKPVVLRTEDDLAYIAIFNREFYSNLIEQLSSLNKTIRFIQSLAYCTIYEENCWSLFLSDHQNFVRTSKYEYYLLDNNHPIPTLLEDMLLDNKPQTVYVYAEADFNPELISARFDIKCIKVTEQLKYGDLIWNFYNQKSFKFKLKLDRLVTISLKRLLKTAKYLLIFAIIFWLIDITSLSVHNIRLVSQIKAKLKIIDPTQVNNNLDNTVKNAYTKLIALKHQNAIYDITDAAPLFDIFLEVVANISPNDITQINYTDNQLEIFLTENFQSNQFSNYQNILSTQKIQSNIVSYKTYKLNTKNKQNDNSYNSSLTAAQPLISDNTAWVVTLKYNLLRNENIQKVK